MNEIWSSYSGLNQHRKCPQQWLYAQSLYRPDTSPAPQRDFGSWWHAVRAADGIKRGRKEGSLKWAPKELRTTDDGPKIPVTESFGPADVIKAARIWWKGQPEEYRAATESILGEPLPQRLLNLFLAWRERWSAEIENEQPLAVELRWTRVQPTTDGNEMNLIGFVDEVYYDTRRSLVVVRDHKTSTRMNAASSLDDLMDSQLHLYSWGAAPIIEEWGLGKVSAVAYDRVQMVAPRPPMLTKAGRLASRLGEPSISGCDLQTYLAWAAGPYGDGVPWGEEGAFYVSGAKKGEPKFGRYVAEQSIIDRLSQPEEVTRWMNRTLTPVNRAIQSTHLRSACDTADDIQRTKVRAEGTSEATRNLGSPCTWCDFASLCRAQMFGGADGEYDLAEHNLKVRAGKTWQ